MRDKIPPLSAETADTDALLNIVRAAKEEVFRLCAGRGRTWGDNKPGRDWTMCIPPQPDDSDTIIIAGLAAALTFAERLRSSEESRVKAEGERDEALREMDRRTNEVAKLDLWLSSLREQVQARIATLETMDENQLIRFALQELRRVLSVFDSRPSTQQGND